MTKGDKVLGIIFPNMHDNAIGELTKLRTMASVPFGGRYRLIDFTLSEMVAAGIDDIGLIVKRNYMSLMDHLGSGRVYDLARKIGGLKIFPPFGEIGGQVYTGKLQALSTVLGYLENTNCGTVILADSGIVSAINYKDVLDKHFKSGAKITALYAKETIDPASKTDNVVFDVDEEGFVKAVYLNDDTTEVVCNSMFAYVIEKEFLLKLVKEGVKQGLTNFEGDVLQKIVKEGVKVVGYEYKGVLKRITSLKAYFDANLDMVNKDTMKALFADHPVYTKIRDDAPVRYAIGSEVKEVVCADGCYIEGYVENSVLFRGVKIGKGAIVRNCVLMHDTVIEDGVVIENVICDKDVVITKEKKLIGDESLPVFVEKAARV